MRLDFGEPKVDIDATAQLFGLTIVIDSARPDVITGYLRSVGINPRYDENLGVVCSTADLLKLTKLPRQVRMKLDPLLRPLYLLAAHPAPPDESAVLELICGELWLRWFDGQTWYDEELPRRSAAALVTSEIPFVGAQPAWDALQSATSIPVRIATCSVSPEGYVEISSTKPQLLEASGVPGLWREGPTRYGTALTYADDLSTMPGFEWTGPLPESGLKELPELPLHLSRHHHLDLPEIVSELSRTGSRMICWGPGLGRRVMALAALESLEAWPALVVSPPWGVWAWFRLVGLFGRTISLRPNITDIRLLTYSDLALGAELEQVSSIIFDDLTGDEASTGVARAGIRRLDGYTQAYRIGLTSNWPDDLVEACDVMDAIRPGEFRLDGQALATRYPLTPEVRATEHLKAYLSYRRHSDPGTESEHRFRHSQVRTVTPAEAELEYHDSALSRLVSGESPQKVLKDVLEVVGAGPTRRLSRKVGAALTMAKLAVNERHRVIILTTQPRAARLLAAALSRTPTLVVSEDELDLKSPAHQVQPGAVMIVNWHKSMPLLPDADEVIVCDYPWSFTELEKAVGPATGKGPALVSLLHSPGTVDDRIAMYAARRSEQDPTGAEDSSPDDAVARWLLRPRGLV